MKKIFVTMFCVVIVLAMITLTGCSGKGGDKDSRTVVDMQGNTVSLPEDVERYCTVYSSSVPMIAMLDKNMEHCIMYPKSGWFEYWEFAMFNGIAEHAERVDKREVTAEQIIESGTQVFFWSKASHQELVDALSEVGIACVNVQVNNTEDLIKALDIIAQVFNTDYAYSQLDKYKATFDEYQKYVHKQVEQIPESIKKSILVIGNVDTLTGYGINTYSADWAKLVGLNYIVPSNDEADEVNLTMEQIYEFDPDIILANGIFDVETTYGDPTWSVLRATKDGMLISNPSVLDFWSMPTTEAPLQYIWALNKFYPEYLGDRNIVEETISFYKVFYGYEMSDEDAKNIIRGEHYLMSN